MIFMARAKCSKCGNIQYWHAYKGKRLADVKSNCCEEPLQGLTAGTEGKNKGRHYEICVICGKKGYHLEKSSPICQNPEPSQPKQEVCKTCGFDKNRISGHIFVRSFEGGGRMTEEARCKECGKVPDYIMMTDKIVKIIYRNFDGSKEYFDSLKKKLEGLGYSVARPLKNNSLPDTLKDMFVNNPEPLREKHILKRTVSENTYPQEFQILKEQAAEKPLSDGKIPTDEELRNRIIGIFDDKMFGNGSKKAINTLISEIKKTELLQHYFEEEVVIKMVDSAISEKQKQFEKRFLEEYNKIREHRGNCPSWRAWREGMSAKICLDCFGGGLKKFSLKILNSKAPRRYATISQDFLS